MAKTQGLMVLQDLQEQSKKGLPPTQTLVEGVFVLIGGVLLVTPGILTDAFGSLIIPFTRKVMGLFSVHGLEKGHYPRVISIQYIRWISIQRKPKPLFMIQRRM